MASNAAAGFLDGATTLAGPLLASVLLGVGGPAWAVGVTVVLLAAAALFAGWLPAPPTMALEATQRSPGHALRTLFHTPEASSAVSDHALAEAFGLLEALIQIAMALGAAVAGVLLHWFDARTSLLIVGLLLPVVAMIAAPFLRRFDARLGHRDLGVELLRRQPVFADLPMPVLDNLGARLAPVGFAAGEVIMSEGDHGDQYVLIVEGVVTFTQLGAVVNVLERGGSFGEIALMRDVPRTATAVATTPVVARTLDREAFLAALGCDVPARVRAGAVADERLARAPGGDLDRAVADPDA